MLRTHLLDDAGLSPGRLAAGAGSTVLVERTCAFLRGSGTKIKVWAQRDLSRHKFSACLSLAHIRLTIHNYCKLC